MVTLADSHIHLFRNGFAGRYGRSPAIAGSDVDVYETLRHVHNIGAALVVGYEAGSIDPSNNAHLRDLAKGRVWMSTVAFMAAGQRPGPAQMEQLLAAGHRGISLYLTETHSAAAIRGWALSAWAVLEEHRGIVSVNLTRDAVPAVASLAADFEGCSFVVSHMGDPGTFPIAPSAADAAERIKPLLDLAARKNVYVKLSGLYAVSDPPHDYPHPQATPFVELLLAAYGPDRCMWGSDFSPSLDYVSFAQVVDPPQFAGLAEHEYARVMGGTLMDLLGQAGRT